MSPWARAGQLLFGQYRPAPRPAIRPAEQRYVMAALSLWYRAAVVMEVVLPACAHDARTGLYLGRYMPPIDMLALRWEG
jgi:hypothetical protein